MIFNMLSVAGNPFTGDKGFPLPILICLVVAVVAIIAVVVIPRKKK